MRNKFVKNQGLSDVFAITFGSSTAFIPVFLVCDVINELVWKDTGRPLAQGC